jgi:hypothetical protein
MNLASAKLYPYFKTNWKKHDWFVFHKFIGTKLKIIEEISWCQMGRTDFKQFMPFSACFFKHFLNLARTSNIAIPTSYIIRHLHLLPPPPKETQRVFFNRMELLGWEDIWANPKDTTQLHLKLSLCHVWNRKQVMLVASLDPWFSSNQNGISHLSIWNPKNLRSTHKIC